jgi:hypothetical protein
MTSKILTGKIPRHPMLAAPPHEDANEINFTTGMNTCHSEVNLVKDLSSSFKLYVYAALPENLNPFVGMNG